MSARRLDRVRLRVASAHKVETPHRPPTMRWWIAAAGGAALVAFVGWLAVTGLVVLGWSTAMDGSFLGPLRFGTQLWLLIHGAGARIGGLTLSLTPLLLSLGVALLLVGSTAYAARQALAAEPELRRNPAPAVLRLVGVTAGTYVALVLLLTIAFGDIASFGRGLLGALLISVPAAYIGAAGTLRYHPTRYWPAPLRVVPKAAGWAALVVACFGALAAIVAIVQHHGRIELLQGRLNAGPIGAVVLFLLQLIFAPDLLLWAMSYVLGAGFRVGADSVVSLSQVQLGLLPTVPILGALPDPGVGRPALAWWLLSGVVAGAVAGYIVVRSRPPARADETALVGGLSGVVAGVLLTLLCGLSVGSLGSDRLADMGPRLKELFIFGTSTLGLAGMASGLILGLLRRPGSTSNPVSDGLSKLRARLPKRGGGATAVPDPDAEETRPLGADVKAPYDKGADAEPTERLDRKD